MKQLRDKYMLKHEFNTFIQHCPEKYRLFWEVVAYGGLRITEAISIKVEDILQDESKILIRTLKRKGRPIIPVIYPQVIINKILSYLQKNKIYSGRIFKFSRQYAWRLFKQILRKAKLNPKYSPHALRHFHAIVIADVTNGDVFRIKDRLRHSSIRSSEVYVHISEEHQKELARKIESYVMGG